MKVLFSRDFYKQYKKADVRIQNSFDEHLRIFRRNPKESQLNNHPLKGKWQDHRSIDITSDYRAIYREKTLPEEQVAHFVALGTHEDLYGPLN